ncbi:GNAT family N-acetyltransferase [Nonomuraea sp. NPDC003804]|uniref:GNAT family N-acetyltransferase n=1 Tax=Nonomuraea sp. NPDC003804 TaxID=3154547 RepID=UPI0033BF41E8
MDVEWGPLTARDAPAWAEFATAVEAVDRTGSPVTVEQMADRLANPLLDLPEGTLAARQDGRIVALGLVPVRQAADPVHVMELWGGGVHPGHRRRGYGRRIIDWSLRTAPVLHDRCHPGKPLHLHLHVDDGNHDLAKLADKAGFEPARLFQGKRRDLAVPIPPPRVPDGVTILTWTPGLDEQAREVRNAAFHDHWGSTPHTPESWKRLITGPAAFRPESSFLATADGKAVGCLLTHCREVDIVATGVREAWVQIIATIAEWRGRGIASALIAHALASFKAQGYATAGLSVDAANETGAVAIYERAGFTTFKAVTTYVHAF